jgi:membrane fusion protein (multidrug efflux system)
VALALVGAWTAWFVLARVAVYEVSTRARLEVDRAVHPVASPLLGRVVASNLALGKAVQAGDPLVELDAESEKRRLEEARKRLVGLKPELDALHRELAATEATVRDDRLATRSALDGARARESELQAAARYATEEARRLGRLREQQGISELELLRVQAEDQKKKAAVEAASLDRQRIEADQRTRDSQSRARMEQIRRDAANLEGQVATTEASVHVLEQEIERHILRAPVSGQLGEVSALQIGAVLAEGERVASVIPSGQLRVVAQFPPAAALGRVRRGQAARVRLDGFPWLQWGSLEARVDSVAAEPRDGLVRVELDVDPASPTRIPLQHGLPGSVEIEVERVSPAQLVLRATGQLAARPAVETPDAPGPQR